MKVKITWSCLTLCNPTDYTVHVILQARILEWIALPFSRGSSQPRDQTQVSHIVGGFFYQLSHKGSPKTQEWVAYSFSSGSSLPRNQIWVSYIAGAFFTNWAIKKANFTDGDTLSDLYPRLQAFWDITKIEVLLDFIGGASGQECTWQLRREGLIPGLGQLNTHKFAWQMVVTVARFPSTYSFWN